MKLNPDCIRDLLLSLEELLQFKSDEFSDLRCPAIFSNAVASSSLMKPYSREDIAYTTQKLVEAGFIEASISYGDNSYIGALYTSITYDGHKFLENVRSDDVWQKAKTFSQKVGSFAIDVLSKVAANIITQRIDGCF